MSTVWLGSLVGLGLLVLVLIAYVAHRMEMSKIERVRLAGLHKDRYRNLQFILDVVPGKAIGKDLLVLIARSMALHMEKVIELQGESKDVLHHLEYANKLQQRIAKGELISGSGSNGTLQENLKNVRRATKLLKDFILQQHRAGFLSKPVASQYIKSLQEINLVATVDGILSQANRSLGEGKNSSALRFFQLALQEMRKSRNPAALAEQNAHCTEAIKRLKSDQKAVEDAAQQLNQKLAKSLTPDSDKKDDGEFDMHQIN
jgi:hypothetical protein